MDVETHPFELRNAGELREREDPPRVVRGRVIAPAGFAASSRPWPHVVVLHGFKGFMDWGFFPHLALSLAERGLAAVCFNMSGSGVGEDPLVMSEVEAFAKNTTTREIEDLEHVRNAVSAGLLGPLDARRAGLFGHSRGGGEVLLHAARFGGWRALATWAAIDEVDRFDEATKDLWRANGFILIPNARTGQEHRIDLDALVDMERNRERLDIEAACRALDVPVLLVHGEADMTVPVAALERLGEALPSGVRSTLRVPGGGHTFGAVHPFAGETPEYRRALDATLEHFERHLARG